MCQCHKVLSAMAAIKKKFKKIKVIILKKNWVLGRWSDRFMDMWVDGQMHRWAYN